MALECNSGASEARLLFALPSAAVAGAQAVRGAELRLSARAAANSVTYAVSYVRQPSALAALADAVATDDSDALCGDVDVSSSSGVLTSELGELTTGESVTLDVAAAVRALLRDGETQLLLVITFKRGALSFGLATPLVLARDVGEPRAAPLFSVDLLDDGEAPPQSACDALSGDCGACLAERAESCGFCAGSGQCVPGDGAGPIAGASACSDGSYAFAVCSAPGRAALPVLAAESCRQAVSGGADSSDGLLDVMPLATPWQSVNFGTAGIVLTFDLRPLRAALDDGGAGGARRIGAATLDLFAQRNRFAEIDADDEATLDVVWLVPPRLSSSDSAAPCADGGAQPRSTVAVARDAPLRLASDAESELPLSSVPLDAVALASVVDGHDSLSLRVSAGPSSDVLFELFSPDLNDPQRRSPRIAIELRDESELGADVCSAHATRDACLARGDNDRCGWCAGSGQCVAGTPNAPYDAAQCSAGYEFARAADGAASRIESFANLPSAAFGAGSVRRLWPDLFWAQRGAVLDIRVRAADLDPEQIEGASLQLAVLQESRSEGVLLSLEDASNQILQNAAQLLAASQLPSASALFEAPTAVRTIDAARGLFEIDIGNAMVSVDHLIIVFVSLLFVFVKFIYKYSFV